MHPNNKTYLNSHRGFLSSSSSGLPQPAAPDRLVKEVEASHQETSKTSESQSLVNGAADVVSPPQITNGARVMITFTLPDFFGKEGVMGAQTAVSNLGERNSTKRKIVVDDAATRANIIQIVRDPTTAKALLDHVVAYLSGSSPQK